MKLKLIAAAAALVVSVSAIAERYLVIDLRSMDYFWMDFSGSQEKRLGHVTFNKIDDQKYTYGSPFAARRYVGAGPFDGYMSVKTFTVKEKDGLILMKGSIQQEQIARRLTIPPYSLTYREATAIRGAFYDSQGNEDGEFIATQDYSRDTKLHYICGSAGHYRCVDWRSLSRGSQECGGKGFPDKFSHLNKESCEDELKSWQADEKARQAEEQKRKEDRICAPENKSASSFSVKRMYGCIEPVSFKTAQTERLLYDKCLVSWVKASRITTFERGSYDSMFSVFKDRTEYEFASTVEETTFDLYFNDDVPEDLKYLVNEAAYSCVVDPFSLPPEGFWPIPWAKPSWEAEKEATD